ncbi:MAG: lipid kinase [Acidobacteriales bacterium]|nr:lipid kinase [Terriglobales bacterium]
MRALALLGPRALTKQVEQFRSGDAEMVVLESPAPDAVARALEARPDVALVFGGDGTLNRHLAALVGSETPVIVVPTGSGNDFARATGTPTIDDAKKVWLAALQGLTKIVNADLGCIDYGNGAGARFFSCCTNIGLDADGARRTDQFPNWVKQNGGYFLGGLMALLRYQPLRMQILCEGNADIDETSWFVSVSNTPTYGGELKIAPQASIVDGFLDVTFASRKNFSRGELAWHFPKILAGEHIKLPQLAITRTRQITVESEAMPIYADGECFGKTPCRIIVRPNALRVVQMG